MSSYYIFKFSVLYKSFVLLEFTPFSNTFITKKHTNVFLLLITTYKTPNVLFEDVSKLFDHAAHNGTNYLNGHCFVSLMLCVPVWNRNRISYLAVPPEYRMWQKKESKLELA